MRGKITAIEMADEKGVAHKRLRAALRKKEFPWHPPHGRWIVDENSPEHMAMKDVLKTLI